MACVQLNSLLCRIHSCLHYLPTSICYAGKDTAANIYYFCDNDFPSPPSTISTHTSYQLYFLNFDINYFDDTILGIGDIFSVVV